MTITQKLDSSKKSWLERGGFLNLQSPEWNIVELYLCTSHCNCPGPIPTLSRTCEMCPQQLLIVLAVHHGAIMEIT